MPLVIEIALGIVLGAVLLIVGYLLLIIIFYVFTEHKVVAWGTVALAVVALMQMCSPNKYSP
jgi:hypothetical protein